MKGRKHVAIGRMWAQSVRFEWRETVWNKKALEETFSERSENLCKDCDYFRITEKDFGCDFDGSCPHDREPDGKAKT